MDDDGCDKLVIILRKYNMNIEGFREWLSLRYDDKFTVSSRISNCKRVEEYYGDLDVLYKKNQCKILIEDLKYSSSDEREGLEPKHKIPIEGNYRTGSATFKQSVNLYLQFLEFIMEDYHQTEKELINDLEFEGLQTIKKVLNKFNYDKSLYHRKYQKQNKVDVEKLHFDILSFLEKEIENFKWESEIRPFETVVGDRVDIYGTSDKNDYKYIIELDAHRADQVSKKFVSRMALFAKEKIVYVSVCYAGTKKMSMRECLKYFDFCKTIAENMNDKYYFGKMLE